MTLKGGGVMKAALVLIFLISGITQADASGRGSKYRQECAFTSSEFVGKLPTGNTDVWCANDRRKDFGPVDRDVIHALVVAAFRERRLDRRQAAMNLLETYDCKTPDGCKEFFDLLDWGVKSSGPHDHSPLKDRGEALRATVTERLNRF